jgi:hypothetical protein
MTSAKLKIDLTHGIIDVEGTEEFVLTVYKDFKEKLDRMQEREPIKQTHDHVPPKEHQVAITTGKQKASGTQPKAKKKSSNQSPSLVKELDLSGNGKCERLKDFYNHYEAKTNFEKNLIFVYYLQEKLGLTGISVDHVFSCYRDVPGIKSPEALRQSLVDTSNRRGWVDTSNTEDIKVTIGGVNYLEHDLPKKGSQ